MRYVINQKPHKQPNLFWYVVFMDFAVLTLFTWDCWITWQYLLLSCSR